MRSAPNRPVTAPAKAPNQITLGFRRLPVLAQAAIVVALAALVVVGAILQRDRSRQRYAVPASVLTSLRQIDAELGAVSLLIQQGKATAAEFAEGHLAVAMSDLALTLVTSGATHSPVKAQAAELRLAAQDASAAADAVSKCGAETDCETKVAAQAGPQQRFNDALEQFRAASK